MAACPDKTDVSIDSSPLGNSNLQRKSKSQNSSKGGIAKNISNNIAKSNKNNSNNTKITTSNTQSEVINKKVDYNSDIEFFIFSAIATEILEEILLKEKSFTLDNQAIEMAIEIVSNDEKFYRSKEEKKKLANKASFIGYSSKYNNYHFNISEEGIRSSQSVRRILKAIFKDKDTLDKQYFKDTFLSDKELSDQAKAAAAILISQIDTIMKRYKIVMEESLTVVSKQFNGEINFLELLKNTFNVLFTNMLLFNIEDTVEDDDLSKLIRESVKKLLSENNPYIYVFNDKNIDDLEKELSGISMELAKSHKKDEKLTFNILETLLEETLYNMAQILKSIEIRFNKLIHINDVKNSNKIFLDKLIDKINGASNSITEFKKEIITVEEVLKELK